MKWYEHLIISLTSCVVLCYAYYFKDQNITTIDCITLYYLALITWKVI